MKCSVCDTTGLENQEIGDDCLKCSECGQCYLRLSSGGLKPFRHLGEFGDEPLLSELGKERNERRRHITTATKGRAEK